MDTYTIFKAARFILRNYLREHNPDISDYDCEYQASDLANDIVEVAIKEGMYYPFSEINKPHDTYPIPMYGMTLY